MDSSTRQYDPAFFGSIGGSSNIGIGNGTTMKYLKNI